MSTAADGRAGWRPWPDSLFGRLLLVLGLGLLVAQGFSAAINWVERDRLMERSLGTQMAGRIADIVVLLDDLDEPGRARLADVFRSPPLVLTLRGEAPAPVVGEAQDTLPWPARRLAERLQAALGDDRVVQLRATQVDGRPTRASSRRDPDEADHHGMGERGRGGAAGPMGPGMMGRGPGASAWHGLVLQVDVRLRDGGWARFQTAPPQASGTLPWRLALTLAVLLASVLVLTTLAVRWTVRPLRRLTAAADALGRDLRHPPLPETGPREVRQAARAFNTMQQRLATFVDERTRALTALSHDLKTPLTRLRLRAELLDDDELRGKVEADLAEMQTMVQQTLDFLRGLSPDDPREPVDVDALLAAIAADQAALGRTVAVRGHAVAPLPAAASLLRRAIGNLVDNAALYGEAGATVELVVEDTPGLLTLRVLDRGPGIPEAELERVFAPYHRLEGSRSRATGGTGLGLGIARNVARGHGGDLVLKHREGGGLEAVLTLPRPAGAAARGAAQPAS